MKRALLLIVGILIGFVITVAVWKLVDRSYEFHGSQINPPSLADDFTLTDQTNLPWTLSDQKGKTNLLFFGYTSCPDVCPMTLTEYMQVKALLGDQADKVNFVYATVDPERDTPEKMGEYLKNFDPEFIGLTGTRSVLENVWKSYGVYQQKVETDSAAGYLVDHSAVIYVIDRDGNLRLTFPYGMDVTQMTDDIRHLLQE
jgi:protein SCO1